jgi:hypothetical protein
VKVFFRSFFSRAAPPAIDRLLGALDEPEDVAHPEDPPDHPVGVERVQLRHALARSRRT